MPGGSRSAVCADHSVGGKGDFELLRFEPFIEEI